MGVDERSQHGHEQVPVAMVGMACRAPGGVASPEELWQLLLDRRDVVAGSDPGGRWPAHERTVPHDLAANGMLAHGAFVDDVDQFDPAFFGIPPGDGPSVDPQHRLLMETTWEALENASIPPRSLAGSRTGLFAGVSNSDYARRFTLSEFDIYHGISAVPSGAPGRISYLLDINGPSLAVDASCASSLVAVHLACRALHDGDVDVAVAGGVTVQLDWATFVGFARAGALSARGCCAAFDAQADGFVRGEGCGVVVLKRLNDALRDGDTVVAVVRGSAVNHVGRTQGLAQPSRRSQRAAIALATASAGIDPGTVGYVEAHGTGTRVGDPIEFAGLADVYGVGTAPCALGSIKTNIGHPESAAGIMGLIKAALAVREGRVPANLHFTRWNPAIDAEGTRFFVPTDTVEWPHDGPGPRRAGVSAFGVTGTNAHVVIEQAPARPVSGARTPPGQCETPLVRVFPLSAGSGGGLRATAARLAAHLDTGRGRCASLADVAHALSVGRSALTTRMCVVAADHDVLLAGLRAVGDGERHPAVVAGATADPGRPVWVFSGHGGQWPGMGADLLDRDPAFTRMIDRLDPVVVAGAGFSVRESLTAGRVSDRMDVIQPQVYAVQVALAAMWRSWGQQPAAVVGQSMGEAAAAVAAGILTPEEGMRIAIIRSRLLQRVRDGGMVTVALPAEQVAADLAGVDDVEIAVVPAPGSTVVAGHNAALARMLAHWHSRGLFAKRIAVATSSHCAMVDPILDELREQTAWLAGAPAEIPFYSTAQPPTEPLVFDGEYWARNLRVPVRFDRTCQTLIRDGHRLFVEVSPHPLLIQAVEDNAAALRVPVITVASLTRGQPGREAMCRAAAELHIAGAPISLDVVNGGGSTVPLPPTAFDKTRHWEQPSAHHGLSQHPWLDAYTTVADDDADDHTRHVWDADVGTTRAPWVAQHTLRGVPIVPGAVYGELLLTAATRILDCPLDQLRLDELRLQAILPVTDTVAVQVSAVTVHGRLHLSVTRHESGAWREIATAVATHHDRRTAPTPPPLALPEEQDPGAVDELYRDLAAMGLDTGTAFHSITALARDARLMRVAVPAEAAIRVGAPSIHPVLLDACLLPVAALLARDSEAPWVPVSVDEVLLPADPARITWVAPAVIRDDDTHASGGAELYDEHGAWLGALRGLRLVAQGAATAGRDRLDQLVHIAWRPAPTPDLAVDITPGRWVVLTEPDDPHHTADDLAAALAQHGAATELVGLDGDRLPPAVVTPTGTDAVVWCATGTPDELDRVTLFATLLREHAELAKPPRIWIVSRNARPMDKNDPAHPGVCALRGLLRVASLEQPASAVSWIDLDGQPDTLSSVAKELLADTPETEVVWRHGERHVARLARVPSRDTQSADTRLVAVPAGRGGYTVRYNPETGVGSAHLAAADPKGPPPGRGQLRVAMRATAVNFRDVMIALGIYPTEDGELPPLGNDIAGVVDAVGPGVDTFSVGDRVLALVVHGGAMASHCLVEAALTIPLPTDADPVTAVANVTSYTTAWLALHDLAGISRDDTVLVHSAAGGLGMAAVAIARLAGARVIATAGTEAKREHLRRSGLDHVFDSRTLKFADDARRVTRGRGVDIVLNSLTGPAMRASLDLLAPTGRFVEVGKRDVYHGTRVPLSTFRAGITYAVFDLVQSAIHHPDTVRAAMRAVTTRVREGLLPALPTDSQPITEVVAALRTLASGERIGRITLTAPPPGTALTVHTPLPDTAIRPGGAYIITGGTTGIGLHAVRWLAEHDAGRIVIGGRREHLDPTAKQIIDTARRNGCTVEYVRGDIADPDTARCMVAAAVGHGHRLAGVLHTALVLADAPLAGVTPHHLARVWHPKVTGLRNLHHALDNVDLDWLVVFSSMSAMLGNGGQAAYAAAGCCVDAFAHWRNAQGLRTVSINWGAWAETQQGAEFTARHGVEGLTNADGFALLNHILLRPWTSVGVAADHLELVFTAFPHALRSPLLAELASRTPTPTQGGNTLNAARTEPAGPARIHLVQEGIRETLAEILSTDSHAIPAHRPFTDIGLDSLLAVALARRLQTQLDQPVTPSLVWAHGTPHQLAQHLDSLLP